MSRKVALITGVTGQDGSYLADLLLAKGYEVHGIVRRSSSINTERIDHLFKDPHLSDGRFTLHFSDLADAGSLINVISKVEPTEIYNLAAQSHVRVSFDLPEYTGEITGIGATRLLEAVCIVNPAIRIYQASSSEMFGATPPPQSETTAFYPRSPYGAAKVYAYWMTKNYREARGLFACNGILFNHESPRRGETFVTRKIAKAAARISLGLQDEVFLGNLDAARDWGYAPEYVEGMWRMMQASAPDDYVLATGTSHTVQEFAEFCFSSVGLDSREYIRFDQRYLRPTEVDSLVGDASKAEQQLGWRPTVMPTELARLMVDAEIARIQLT